MKQYIMFVGHSGVGKTTVAQCIEGNDTVKPRGQSVVYGTYTMDCPSIYVENPFKYDALIALSQQAKAIFFIIDPTQKYINYPPGFSTAFQGRHYGIISKCDVASVELINAAERKLKKLGIQEDNILHFSLESKAEREYLLTLAYRICRME